MAEMTRDQFITVRMAEGFSREAAEHAYDGTIDPQIEAAQEQKVPTRGEMIEAVHTARLNNPNRKKLYKPDFSLSEEYLALKAKANEAAKVGDYKLAENASKQMLSIQISGTVTNEERQTEIDKTLEMPIAAILKEQKRYEAIITECEDKLDNFDVSGVQAKVDALDAQYKSKISNARDFCKKAALQQEYHEAVEDLERKLIIIPMNDLKLKRYHAKEFYLIYEARVSYYITANEELIRAEIENAKREEIRGSLADLAEAVEKADAKKAALVKGVVR